MRTASRLSLLVALVAALFSPTQSVAGDACATSQWFEHYEVSLKADRKVYRLGDRAIVTAKVTNVTTGTPERDVDVTVGAVVKHYYVNGAGKTNAAGVAKVKLRLDRRYMKPGSAELRGLARTYHDEGDAVCAGVGLYGFEKVKDAFTVKR